MENIENLMEEKCAHISKDMYPLSVTKYSHYYNLKVKMPSVRGVLRHRILFSDYRNYSYYYIIFLLY